MPEAAAASLKISRGEILICQSKGGALALNSLSLLFARAPRSRDEISLWHEL